MPSHGASSTSRLAGSCSASYMRAIDAAELRKAGCVVTSSTRSPLSHTSRPSRMLSRYSSPFSGRVAAVGSVSLRDMRRPCWPRGTASWSGVRPACAAVRGAVLARAHAVGVAEAVAEVRGVGEAPAQGDAEHRLLLAGRVAQVTAAALQPLRPDPLPHAASL